MFKTSKSSPKGKIKSSTKSKQITLITSKCSNSKSKVNHKKQIRTFFTQQLQSLASSPSSLSPSSQSVSTSTSSPSPIRIKSKFKQSTLQTSTKSFSTLTNHHSSLSTLTSTSTSLSSPSLITTSAQNRSFSTTDSTSPMETIDQALSWRYEFKSTLNFTTLKHDFCGLLQYLNHIFESNEFKTAATKMHKDQINQSLGQFPMYISQLSTPIEMAGRSAQQDGKHNDPIGKRWAYPYPHNRGLIEIPAFLHFHCPELEQIFFTPQQSILLFGTLCGAINSYERKINPKKREYNPQRDDDSYDESLSELTSNIYQRLADELSMEKEQLIKILAQCYSLVFNGKFQGRYDESFNLIYTSPATGTSTLYPILSILFHQLNLPFAYLGYHEAADGYHINPVGFYYAPSKSKEIKVFNHYPDATRSVGHSNFSIQNFDKATIMMLVDFHTDIYTAEKWGTLQRGIEKYFDLHPHINPTVFSFHSANDSIIRLNQRKYETRSLFIDRMFAYNYSPSMFNFKLGITQLHLFRYFQHYAQQQLLSSLSLPQSNNEQEQQQQQSTSAQEQQQQLTSEQQQLYFGQKLFELINNSQNDFEQLLQSLSTASISTTSTEELNSTTSPTASTLSSTETNHTSTTIEAITTQPIQTTKIAQINQLLQTQLINNPKYYQLFYDIVFHPITDILSAKVSTITTTTESPSFNTINTIDSKKILSTIINDINIHDNNNNDDDIINTNIPITTIATSSTTTQKVTKQTQSKSNAVVKTTTSKAKTTNNQTNVTNSNESLITVPCLYLIPKLPYNSTNTNFNNTKMIEQYWKQFQLQQQKQDQSSNKTQIQSDYEDQSSNNNQPSISSTLFSTIHNLWFDLSLFTLYSLPTHRFVSTLAARPIRQDGQHAHGIYPIEYNLSQISPTCGDSDFICLEGPKHLYQSKNLLPADQRWFRLPLYNRKAEEGLKEAYKGQYWEYGDYVTNHFRKTPESNWVNSIIAFSQHFDCYLPFNHFNTKPISDIISHNKQYGFQQPISSMIEQRKPDISSDDFEAMALHYAHDKFKDYPHLMFIPPEHYKYANIVFTQEKSMLFLRFGSKDLFSNTVIFAKSSVGLNYGFGEYTKNGIDIYQVDVVLEEGLNNEIQANDEQLISKVNYLLQPMFTSNKKSPQSFVTAVGKINYEPIDNVKY